jgi:hypothetical protein
MVKALFVRDLKMKPFLSEKNVSLSRLKKLMSWAKKNRKFGAYIETEEVDDKLTNVKLYCPMIKNNKVVK